MRGRAETREMKLRRPNPERAYEQFQRIPSHDFIA
jgi:hypothetical protein